MYYGIES